MSQTYQFGYDDYGNVARVKVGSKTLAQYAYGANNGPLSKLTYGNGDTVNYTYDQYGRLKQEIQDDGSTMTYTYNGEGMLYSAAESGAGRNIRTVYTYDTLDRLIYKDFVKGTTSSLRYSAGYNNKNQLVTRGWATNGLNYQENFTYNSADGTLDTMTIDTDATTGVEHTFQLYYDELRRLLTENRGAYSFSYTYKDLSDTQTTNQIQSLSYSGAAGNIGFHYTYDALGNIVTYQEPSGTFTYTYDAQGQLTKAVKGSTTYNYSYDSVGNILTANGHTYTYGNSDWKDLLTAYDGQSITYDGSGNPTSYYNGTRWTLGWTNGRSLISASNGTTTATYAYNLDGSRSSKTVNGVPHYYLWQDGKPIKEYVDGNSDIFDRYDTLYFLYDENGRPFALIFNGTTYYYVLNLQGDVMRLVTSDGTIVAEYTYDPYGNILTATGDLAQINPLRYRGYYYDTELGMYFLNSRYYDPKIGRCISADSYVSTGQGIIGYNMFSYCAGNPVNYADNSGSRCVAVADVSGGHFSASTTNANSLPPKGDPNSNQTLRNPDGTPKQKRWYGPDGNAERDRDYKHGGDMPFPHDHVWKKGKRGKEHLPPSPDYKFSTEPLIGATIMVTYTVGIIYIVMNDMTGVGLADNLLVGPLVDGIREGMMKIFK